MNSTIEYPSKQQLTELLEQEKGPCVSILMPTHESGRETNQNPIRFKNLVKEAMDRVVEDSALHKQLSELAALENDFEFWQHQAKGLAIYVTETSQQFVKLSHRVDETVYLGDQFYIRPLAGHACGQNSYLVLALSWTEASLHHADAHDVQEVDNDRFPATMSELVLERDPEEQLQYTSHQARGQGAGPSNVAMYHGHGEGEHKIEADRHAYLHRVGELLKDEQNDGRPLLLFATEEVAGHFTSISELEPAGVVHVSPDGLDDQQLADRAREWVKEHQAGDEMDVNDQLGSAIANKSGSDKIEQIVIDAANGRVETLLLGETPVHWGEFDRAQQKVLTGCEPGSGMDLVNFAVHETLKAGGDVRQIHQQPKAWPVAALYRY